MNDVDGPEHADSARLSSAKTNRIATPTWNDVKRAASTLD